MAGSVALAFDILARDKASKTFDDIGGSAEKTGGRIKGMAKTAGAALGGLFAANKAKEFFGTAIAGAREAIEIDKQTEAVIKSTGGAAGVTADHIDKLSNKLQRQQTISDEVVQSGANLLLTFTNIRNEAGKGNDVFDQTVALTGDMSKALGQDAKASAIQLGKALNDPVKGITALSRVGVSFTEQQKEQIKVLTESGDTVGAQKVILEELQKQFGGSAAAQADAADKMGLAWDDFQEVVGRAVLPIVDKLTTALTKVTRWAADNPGQLKVVAGVVGGALALAFTAWAVSAASAAAATIAAAAPVIAITAAVAALAAGVVYAYKNWDWFREAVQKVARFLTGTVWPAIKTGAEFITGTLVPAIADAMEWFIDFGADVFSVVSKVASWIGEKVGAIVNIFTGTLLPIITKVIGWYWDFYSAVFETLTKVAAWILDRVNAIVGFFTGTLWPGIQKVIGFFGDLYNSIHEKVGAAAEFVADRVRAIVGFVTDLKQRVSDIASGIFDPLSEAFRGIVNGIIGAWNRLDFGIDIRVPGWVPGIGGKGFHVDDIFPDVPTLHRGGTVTATGIRPLRSDEILARLQLEETVIPRGGVAGTAGGGDTYNFELPPSLLERPDDVRRELESARFLTGKR